MEATLDSLLLGFSVAFRPDVLLYAFLGCLVGTLVGMLPVSTGAMTYFTHSYAAPVTPATVASADYGSAFTAVVEDRNIFGVQFHPEKSSDTGLQILRSFVQISKFPDFQISKC